jgi:dihydrofolate reductase
MIKAILACDDLGGVSKGGTIPWPKNSKDLKWFKKNTTGGVIVMGSTTWEDPMMPGPLPNRKNVLATTRKKDYPGAHDYIDGVLSEEVWRIANKNKEKTTWVIGGPNIINQLLGAIDEFYLSRIPGDYGCDTFLPIEKIEKMFKKDWSEKHDTVEFQIWKKDNQ